MQIAYFLLILNQEISKGRRGDIQFSLFSILNREYLNDFAFHGKLIFKFFRQLFVILKVILTIFPIVFSGFSFILNIEHIQKKTTQNPEIREAIILIFFFSFRGVVNSFIFPIILLLVNHTSFLINIS